MSLELNNIAETPQAGLNLSADPSSFQQGDYSYMLNGALYDQNGKAPFARMYKGNRFACKMPSGYYPVGSANIAQKESCIFLVNPATGDSEIGVFDGRKYSTVASDVRMGFRIDKQIQAFIDEDFNGSKTVIWVQEDAPIRIMDLNNPPQLNGQLDIDALNLFRKYNYPEAKIQDVTNNGRILAGSYYISLQYADENGNGLTSCTTPVGPVKIYRDTLTQPKSFVNGSPTREPTDKSILIGLSNLDISFKYVNIVVVKSYEGIRSAVVAATVPTYQSTYLYTGIADLERDITLDDVLTPGVSYASAKTIAQSNGVALIGNLKGKKEFNLQPYISQIGVQWQVSKERYDNAEASYANPMKNVYELQYRRNEVYDLGVVIRWTDGTKSRVYPLIAREKNKAADGLTITRDKDEYGTAITQGWDSQPALVNDDLEITGATPERWKHGNTALVMGDDIGAAQEGPSLYGEFGYYESTDTYPNNPAVWGANAGKPIRRFKMPDLAVAPLIDGKNEFRGESDIVSIYRLGVRFTNIEDIMNSLPAEIQQEMAGYELVRADRRSNKSVIGSGLLFNMWYQNWTEEESFGIPFLDITFPSSAKDDVRLYANYPLNDLRDDELIDKIKITDGDNSGIPGPNDRYRKDVFTFLSPDTSFQKNLLFSGKMLIHQEQYGIAKASAAYLSPYPELQDKSDNDVKSAYQMLVRGFYNNWKPMTPGQLQRKISESMYIPFSSQVASGNIGLPIENITRESTVLVGTTKPLEDPSITDTSRARLTDSDFNCSVNKQIRNRSASALYVSLVSPIANQYGSVFDPRYCFTNFDNTNIKNNTVVFGGDSYVAPYSVKRQLVFYQNAQAFKDLPDGELGIDLKNSDTINGTKYYYEGFRKKARKDSATQCESGSAVSKMPVIYTGIPIFFCESDYDIDLRVNGDQEFETFYPNLKDGSISVEDWTGIKHVDKDNDYRMNESYNEINDLYGYQNADPFYNPLKDSQTDFSTRVIFSLPGSPENRFNNLQVFLPLNYHDFPRDCGELWDIRDVGNYRCLFRFEHAFYMDKIYAGLATQDGVINLGSGRLFESAPIRLSKSDDGYSGSSEQWAFNNTPFGAFCTDAIRGANFVFGESLNDISANNVDSYMMENMPFKLLEAVSSFVNKDNPANPEGIGYHSVYDTINKLWIVTKRDYELIAKDTVGEYTVENGLLRHNGGSVSLQNKKLFHDRSWTMGYDPRRQRWIGWYSFKPTFYLQLRSKFYAFQDGALWCYDNPVPRTYFGKREPFVIETVLKTPGTYIDYTSSFVTRAFPILNGETQGESFDDTFNKGYVRNEHQCTGLYDLQIQDENDLSSLFKTPPVYPDRIVRYLRRLNQSWNIDQLYDLVKDHRLPFLLPGFEGNLDNRNFDYLRDYKQAAVLRDMWSKHRYIYDREKDIQLYLYLIQGVTEISIK